MLFVLALLVAAFALLVAAFAGCQGSKASSNGPADGLSHSFDDGAVRGIVVDEGGTPVPKALVKLGSQRVERTNASGAFLFDHVTPSVEALIAEAEGFEPVAAQVEILAGQVAEVTLTLPRLAEVEIFVDQARLDFAGGLAGTRPAPTGLVRANQNNFSHTWTVAPVAVVSTVRWELASPPGPPKLSLALTYGGPPGGLSIGPSPVTTRLDFPPPSDAMSFTVTFGPPPGCQVDDPCATDLETAAFVAVDVRATIVSAMFSAKAPPADFIVDEPS